MLEREQRRFKHSFLPNNTIPTPAANKGRDVTRDKLMEIWHKTPQSHVCRDNGQQRRLNTGTPEWKLQAAASQVMRKQEVIPCTGPVARGRRARCYSSLPSLQESRFTEAKPQRDKLSLCSS